MGSRSRSGSTVSAARVLFGFMAPLQRTMESRQQMCCHGDLQAGKFTSTRCTADLGDEIWDAGSSDSSLSESEGEQVRGRGVAAFACSTAVPTVAPAVAAQKAATLNVAASVSQAPPKPVMQVPTVPSLNSAGVPQATMHGSLLMALVFHLRGDNSRLREALVQAQRESERFAQERGQDGKGDRGIDFSHLLALATEFGEGLGGFGASDADGSSTEQDAAGAAVFSIFSPRGEAAGPHDISIQDEHARLQKELQEARSENALLREELAARDAAILTPCCSVCGTGLAMVARA